MKPPKSQTTSPGPWGGLLNLLLPQQGSVLAYLVVVILIFGVLGVIIVSLFTTSTTSSATPNDARRADYIMESAIRYATSELRNTNFATATVDALNNRTYNVAPSGSFTVNVFGPWFDFVSYDGSDLSLTVPEGKIPEGFSIPVGLWYVNYDHIGTNFNLTSTRNSVKSGSTATPGNTTLVIKTSGDFIANPGERICLAVKPEQSKSPQTLSEGGNLYVERVAKNFFPDYNGAVNIQSVDYVYERLDDPEPLSNWVLLVNLSAAPMPNITVPSSVLIEHTYNGAEGTYDGDFIVLSPRNHIVIPTASSGAVTLTGKLEDGVNLYDTFPAQAMARKPDITADDLTSNLSEKETDQNFIKTDTDADTLNIGGGVAAGSSSTEFGAGWYDVFKKSIGGSADYCDTGKCLFKYGIRVFFTLAYSGTGEGLTFALLNGALNDTGSAGGDIQLPELLGYAGDSRTDPGGSPFLDESGEGLQPPKIALEFDMRTDNSNFKYCADANNVNLHTRKDPLANDKDAVQYVFWGNTSLDITCRDDNPEPSGPPSYDDNRHAAEKTAENPWEGNGTGGYFQGSGDITSRPAVVPGDAVYVTTNNGRLHAINLEDGTHRWTFSTHDQVETSSPAVSNDAKTIYFSSYDKSTGTTPTVWAINAGDGSQKWAFPVSDGNDATDDQISESTPAVDKNGVIYVGSRNGNLYAIDPNGTLKWAKPTGGEVRSSPVVDRTGGDYDGTIYVIEVFGTIRAFNPDGSQRWASTLSGYFSTAPALSKDGSVVYVVDSNDSKLYAINASNSSPAWTSPFYVDLPGNSGSNDPVVDHTDSGFAGTIYHVTDDGQLFAVKPDGNGWRWDKNLNDNSASSPAIGADGVIYVGSDDGYLYAISPADEYVEWSLDTCSISPCTTPAVKSDPAIGPDGTVYFGNDDDKVFARNRIARPPNRSDLLVTSTGIGTNVRVAGEPVDVKSETDWLLGNPDNADIGPWAVRLEVMRSTTKVNDKYEYTLHAWVRQCKESDCNDVLGTFYEDTRIQYATNRTGSELPLAQTIELNAAEHGDFTQFLFGFTGAVAANNRQDAVIDHFQLSFIRPNDPIITTDPDWPPP